MGNIIPVNYQHAGIQSHHLPSLWACWCLNQQWITRFPENVQLPIVHCEMVGAEEISSVAFRNPAGDHSDSLSSPHLHPHTSMALIDINDPRYELYWWLTHVSRNAAPLEGKRRSVPSDKPVLLLEGKVRMGGGGILLGETHCPPRIIQSKG